MSNNELVDDLIVMGDLYGFTLKFEPNSISPSKITIEIKQKGHFNWVWIFLVGFFLIIILSYFALGAGFAAFMGVFYFIFWFCYFCNEITKMATDLVFDITNHKIIIDNSPFLVEDIAKLQIARWYHTEGGGRDLYDKTDFGITLWKKSSQSKDSPIILFSQMNSRQNDWEIRMFWIQKLIQKYFDIEIPIDQEPIKRKPKNPYGKCTYLISSYLSDTNLSCGIIDMHSK